RRPTQVLKKYSADFWKEFNEAAKKGELPTIQVGKKGLPTNLSAAYQYLFRYDVLNLLFAPSEPKNSIERYMQEIESRKLGQINSSKRGERFLKGFLRYWLLPGSEHGYGVSGGNDLNSAHL